MGSPLLDETPPILITCMTLYMPCRRVAYRSPRLCIMTGMRKIAVGDFPGLVSSQLGQWIGASISSFTSSAHGKPSSWDHARGKRCRFLRASL